jgi:hypothetical protein
MTSKLGDVVPAVWQAGNQPWLLVSRTNVATPVLAENAHPFDYWSVCSR